MTDPELPPVAGRLAEVVRLQRNGLAIFAAAGLALAVATAWVIAAPAVASAEDGAPPAADPTAVARAAYEAMGTAQEAYSAGKDPAKREQLGKKRHAAVDKFCEEFDKLDWVVWDLALDADILFDGVDRNARRAFDAEDFARARKGWEYLAERMPADVKTGYTAIAQLTLVYAATAALDDGGAQLRKYVPKLSAGNAAYAWLGIGDLSAAKSDFGRATKAYAEAKGAYEKAVASKERVDVLLDMRLTSRARCGEQVRDLTGTDSESKRALRLSDAAGRPILCLAFGLFGHPRTRPLQALATMQKKYGPKGLFVVGFTTFDLLGPMTRLNGDVDAPLPRDPDDTEGETVNVSRRGFPGYVENFRQRVRAPFPLVVAGDEALKGYADFVSDGMLLLDADRRIVLMEGALEGDTTRWLAQAVCVRYAAAHAPVPAGGK